MSDFVYLNFRSYIYTFKNAFKFAPTDKELVEWLFEVSQIEYVVNASTTSKLLNDSSKIPQKIVEAFLEKDESVIVKSFEDSFEKLLDPTRLTIAKDIIVELIEADTTISKTIKEFMLSKSKTNDFRNELVFMAHVFLYVVKSKGITSKRITSQKLSSIAEHGIIEAYHDVKDIPYTQFITDVIANIDIVHIHGASWINDRRIEIREKMKDPNVTIRLLLLSPKSPFFKACEEFLPYYREKAMISRLKSALETWERSYVEATKNRTISGAKIHVFLTQQFPTKSLYRFDNIIIINPTYMGKDRVTYLPTLCCESRAGKENFFNAYLQEIEDIINESDICFDATTTSLDLLASRLDAPLCSL